MSETKHTPGPWTIEEYGDDETPSLVIHKDSETRVCFMATPGSMGDPVKIEADAHLIAAAPDMLAALKALDILIDFSDKDGLGVWMFEDTTDISAAMDLAKAAIDRTKGRHG